MTIIKKTIILFFSVILLSGCENLNKEQNSVDINLPDSLETYNSSTSTLKAQIIGDRTLWVYQPVSHNKYIAHFFEKNHNDDFILYSSTILGSLDKNNTFNPETYITAGSNKEFAFRARPAGSDEGYVWFPEHENIGTAFAIDQKIKFNDVDKSINSQSELVNVNSVTIQQIMNLKYPGTPESVAILELTTVIDESGVTYQGEVEWLQQLEIERGYVGMLPTVIPPMQLLLTSDSSKYELSTNNDYTDILNSQEIDSFSFISKPIDMNGKNLNIILSEKIHNKENTLRLSESGTREEEIIWLEHRSESVQKVYPQIYQNYTTYKNESFSFAFTIFVGVYPEEKLLESYIND